nr:immunoglobulin heavy chain junction region [Macaca mulatta]MOY26144.1 immunoglobulin heavy chain junction region [Macaca mulatta]MOY28221.1 immunoglobulin heavy chain junction region [Macaca mulatta]MOY29322.1 immunoglobulin heavy chain junction region [Macaca mulatta]MOY29446.1 immunoglobulin heavy chain junction region [Macaca mulatta]
CARYSITISGVALDFW